MNFTKNVINEYKNYKMSDDVVEMCNNFFNSNVKCIIGRNEYSKEICQKLKIDYIIDDYTNEKTFCNVPIIKFEQIPQNASVLNCVLNARYTYIYEKLQAAGYKNTPGFLDLCNLYPEKFNHPYWINDMRTEFLTNTDRFENIYNILNDETSKKTFQDVILFRLTADRKYLSNYEIGLENQYFEDFSLKNTNVFVDCGAFDGATSKQFIKNCPNYNKIYLFEPSNENIVIAKENLKDYKNIEYINKGTADKVKTVRFNTSLGSSSNVDENGEIEIEVVPIDNYVKDSNALLKMDIEGSESSSLIGAKNFIQKYKPNMAICIYHKATDFYQIYEYIKEISEKPFKTYIRHYSQGWNETVMFFTYE